MSKLEWSTFVVSKSIPYSLATKIAGDQCPDGFVMRESWLSQPTVSAEAVAHSEAKQALSLYEADCWTFYFVNTKPNPTPQEEVK